MKALLPILLLMTLMTPDIEGQGHAELFLDNNRLKGTCENPYFLGFEIELDSVYSSLDSLSLFSQLPRVGNLNFRNKAVISTEFTLTERAGYPQIMFRFKSNWYTFDDLQFTSKSILFSIDTDPDVPATLDDLKIVQLAKNLLSEETYWNKNDDRDCSDDVSNKSYSLYCALRIASLQVEERYNHRNAALQKLRHLIEDKYPHKVWQHRLMDFNNMEETNYNVIIEILDIMESEFTEEIIRKNQF